MPLIKHVFRFGVIFAEPSFPSNIVLFKYSECDRKASKYTDGSGGAAVACFSVCTEIIDLQLPHSESKTGGI